LDAATTQAILIASSIVPLVIWLIKNVLQLDKTKSTYVLFVFSIAISFIAVWMTNEEISWKDISWLVLSVVVAKSVYEFLSIEVWPTRLTKKTKKK